MSNLQSGDTIRHTVHGMGTVERIERNAFGKVTRAWVRFRGDLKRVWIDDASLMQTAQPAMFTPRVVADGPQVA
jgi:hypothetical protein